MSMRAPVGAPLVSGGPAVFASPPAAGRQSRALPRVATPGAPPQREALLVAGACGAAVAAGRGGRGRRYRPRRQRAAPARSVGERLACRAAKKGTLESQGAAVGIDLGTTNSAVAVQTRDGKFVVVPPKNARSGRYTMPSVVAYNAAGKVLVGTDALRVKHDGERQCVFRSLKRLVGRTYQDARQAGINPSALGADPRGRAGDPIRLLLPGGKTMGPEVAIAQLIKALVAHAEAFLGCRVTRAVMGVPARFNQNQLRAMEYAAELSGIQYVRLAREPELAVRTYGYKISPKNYEAVKPEAVARADEAAQAVAAAAPVMDGDTDDSPYDNIDDMIDDEAMTAEDEDEEIKEGLENLDMRHVMVADVGGGTFDVCIVRHIVDWDEIHMLFTAGDERLGGDDYDIDLAKWAEENLKPSLSNQRVCKWPLTPENRRKLRMECRRAKEKLSSMEAADISFAGAKLEITRSNFNAITLDTTKRLLRPIRESAAGSSVRLPYETFTEEIYGELSHNRSKRRSGRRDAEDKQQERLEALWTKAGQTDAQEDDEAFVDVVLCVGAASWTPAVRDLLKIVTGCKPNLALVDPETAVAIGAALQAAVIDSKIGDMHVHSNWRAAWATYVMKHPRIMDRIHKEKAEKAAKAARAAAGPDEEEENEEPVAADQQPVEEPRDVHSRALEILTAAQKDPKCTKLHLAAAEGDVAVITAQLQRSPDPASLVLATAGKDTTPLHLAALRGKLAATRALLHYAADRVDEALRAAATGGYTALHLAAQQGHADVLQALLEHSPDHAALLTQKAEGSTMPLHLAAIGSHAPATRVLLESAPDPEVLMRAEADGSYLPLHCAAATGGSAAIAAMLEHAADAQALLLRQLPDGGYTALHLAAQADGADAARALLDGAADCEALLYARDSTGNSPLHAAAQFAGPATIEAMLTRSRDPEALAGIRCEVDGWTPLHNAASSGQASAIRALLKSVSKRRSSSLALAMSADDGSTPLHLAAEKGHTTSILALLKHAAVQDETLLSARDGAGRTPAQRVRRDTAEADLLQELVAKSRGEGSLQEPVGAGQEPMAAGPALSAVAAPR